MTVYKNIPPGVRILSDEESGSVDLGPLAPLMGTWTSAPGQGWNTISVPAPRKDSKGHGFLLEVIPYVETLTFRPAVAAGNRGPVSSGNQTEQQIVGLIYQQEVISDCSTDFCAARGFAKGVEIHAETGMILLTDNANPSVSVARLGTIPHGNSILLLGSATTAPGAPNIGELNTASTLLDGTPTPPGYDEFQGPQFPNFNQDDPNTTLREAIKGQDIIETTTLSLTTEGSTGGILNIPFIDDHINATKMACTYWIEKVKGPNGDYYQLQYSQNINLVFPPAGGGGAPLINWPHTDINTLLKSD